MVKRRTEFKDMYLVDAYLLNRLSNENKNINYNTSSISINDKPLEKEWTHQSPDTNKEVVELSPSNNLIKDTATDDTNSDKYDCMDCNNALYKTEEIKGEGKFEPKDHPTILIPKKQIKNFQQSANNSFLGETNLDIPMMVNNIQSFPTPMNQTPSNNTFSHKLLHVYVYLELYAD